MDLLINTRIDALTDAVDAFKATMTPPLTQGELLVWSTMIVAGLLEDAHDRDALEAVLGVLLAVTAGRPNVKEYLRLLTVCGVTDTRIAQGEGD